MNRPDEGGDRQHEQDDGETPVLHAGAGEAITDCHGQIVESRADDGNLGRELYVPFPGIDMRHAVRMGWTRSRPARSASGAYYEVAASPRGDIALWYPGTNPLNPGNATPGVLGLLSFLINMIVFQGRWRVVVRQFAESRDAMPTTGVLWRDDVRKRDVDTLMQKLVSGIEAGTFQPEQAADGVV